jgi:hypothetical protein
MSESKTTKQGGGLLYLLLCLATSMIGYTIHGSIFWAIIDWIFMPIAWCKWLICHEVNMTIIRETFSFFFK